jgi:diacylglycerol kinase (ATP)
MKVENQILLVVNPISGRYDKSQLIQNVRDFLLEKELELKIYKTTGENDEVEIAQLIDEIRPERVLVAGGDGTIQLVATVLKNYDLILGIIPAGSANGFALNLDLPKTLAAQLEIALGENTFVIDTLELNGIACLHIADMGVNAELIRNYKKSNIKGKWGYFLQSFPTLFKSNYPYKFIIEAKDHIYVKKGILLAIANANKFGTGANINPSGKLNDGKFEVLIFKRMSLIQIIKTLFKNTKLDSDFAEVISTEKAVITCNKPIAFQIDGEFIGKRKKIVAKIADLKLKIAVPKAFASVQ